MASTGHAQSVYPCRGTRCGPRWNTANPRETGRTGGRTKLPVEFATSGV